MSFQDSPSSASAVTVLMDTVRIINSNIIQGASSLRKE